MWQMEKALGMWKIKESALPAWIVDLEQDLDMVIQEEESQLGRLVK